MDLDTKNVADVSELPVVVGVETFDKRTVMIKIVAVVDELLKILFKYFAGDVWLQWQMR